MTGIGLESREEQINRDLQSKFRGMMGKQNQMNVVRLDLYISFLVFQQHGSNQDAGN